MDNTQNLIPVRFRIACESFDPVEKRMSKWYLSKRLHLMYVPRNSVTFKDTGLMFPLDILSENTEIVGQDEEVVIRFARSITKEESDDLVENHEWIVTD